VNPSLHALVVDDSAVVRHMAAEILSRAGFSVAVAADPFIALTKMRQGRPDVILLDLEMPRMHGLEFLRRVMDADPVPIVVCSGSISSRGADLALEALEQGAVDVVAKPRLGVKGFLEESATSLVDTMRAAAGARFPRARASAPRREAPKPPRAPMPTTAPVPTLLALGASTGGPEALRAVLEALPADGPGVVVVQHMPEGFTRAFAERLDRTCRLEVREARDGDALAPGTAFIAPGNRHLEVRGGRGRYHLSLQDGDRVNRHRPSVDVLFRSVAAAAGGSAVGALLTGMGDDGARGLLEMRRAGALTLAQDEASSVVFGMPGSAIELAAAEHVVPLGDVAAAVLRHAARPVR